MKIVLLSGGSGKRLWPLSDSQKSKQFLKLIETPARSKLSMLEHTVAHLKRLNRHQDTIVVATQQQIPLLRSQIGPDILCVAEPERRDTFPAIALAAAYLHSIIGAEADEIVVVLPVDAFAEHSFFERLADLEAAMLHSPWAAVGLIGVKPQFPSEQYGYVRLQSADGELMPVAGFKEKPGKEEAERLIREHALWNCGVFAFRLAYMLGLLAERGLPLQLEPLRESYSKLPARSFDLEVLERADRIGCLLYEGRWRDMGTWNAVLEDRAETIIGEGLADGDCEGTKVLNELPLPIVVSGVQDTIVVAGQSGILIAGKDRASSIKHLVERLEASAEGGLQPDRRSASPHKAQEEAQDGASGQARSAGGWSRLLDRHADHDANRLVITTLHFIPAGGEIDSLPGALRSSWTIAEGAGIYRAGEAQTAAACGSMHTSGERMSFAAAADSRLIETVVTTISGTDRTNSEGSHENETESRAETSFVYRLS